MRAFLVLVACALALPVGALAQGTAVKASALIGMDVLNTASGTIGRIRDLIVDIGNNRLHYAELDMPGRLFAAPPDQLALQASSGHAVFTPGDRAIEPRAGMALARASNLVGWEVTSEAGERIGRVLDLAIDPLTGRVPFAVLQLNDPRATGAPLHPVPTDAFAVHALRDTLVMTIDLSRLQPLSSFTLEQLDAGLSDAGFVGRHAAYAARLTPEPAAAGGATQPGDNGLLFERLDRNGDGYLSDTELGRAFAESNNWMAIDLDGDSRISRSEFSAVRQ